MYSLQQLPINNGEYKILKQKGIEAIDALAAYVKNSQDIEIIESNQTNVSFKLFDLEFKTRVEFDKKWIEGVRPTCILRTYSVEESSEGAEEVIVPGTEFVVDKLGNIGRDLNASDFYYTLFDLLIPNILNEMEIKL